MKFRHGSSPRRLTDCTAWRATLRRGRRNPALSSLALLLALATPLAVCRADNFTTSAQENSTQTWNDAVWEPGPVSPSRGNTYEVLSGGVVRAPSAATFMVFSGNSLTLDEGARLFVTSSSDQTLLFPGPDGNPCLILNGGFLEEGLQSGNSSTFTILGRMAVVAPPLFITSGLLAGS